MNKIRIFFSVALIAGLLLSESVQAITFTQVKNYATAHKKPLIVASALSAVIIGAITYSLLKQKPLNQNEQDNNGNNQQDRSNNVVGNVEKPVEKIPVVENERVDEVVVNDDGYGVFLPNERRNTINSIDLEPKIVVDGNKDIEEILSDLIDEVVDNYDPKNNEQNRQKSQDNNQQIGNSIVPNINQNDQITQKVVPQLPEKNDEGNDNSNYNPQLCYTEHELPSEFFIPQVFNPGKKFIPVKNMSIELEKNMSTELDSNESLIQKISVLNNGQSIEIKPGNYFCIDEGHGDKVVYWYTIDKKRILQFVPINSNMSLSLTELKEKKNNFFFGQVYGATEGKRCAGYWIVRKGVVQHNPSVIDISSDNFGSLRKINSQVLTTWSYYKDKGTKIFIESGKEFVLKNKSVNKLVRNNNGVLEILHLDGWQKIEKQMGNDGIITYDNNNLKAVMLDDVIRS
jgi:hypothetical protein